VAYETLDKIQLGRHTYKSRDVRAKAPIFAQRRQGVKLRALAPLREHSLREICGGFSTFDPDIIFFFNFPLLSPPVHPVKIPGSGNFRMFPITYFCNRYNKIEA
jgi:hypothetical protein